MQVGLHVPRQGSARWTLGRLRLEPALEDVFDQNTLLLPQANPHTPHPGRAPDSPLSDIIELRDMLMPSKHVVAMFPVGVGSGATVDGLDAANGGVFGLPESAGVFQIGTK